MHSENLRESVWTTTPFVTSLVGRLHFLLDGLRDIR